MCTFGLCKINDTKLMKKYWFIAVSALVLLACKEVPQDPIHIESPNSKIKLIFALGTSGEATYSISYDNKQVIDPSTMGFEFTDMLALSDGLKISGIETNSFSETWAMPWGEQDSVLNQYNRLFVSLKETKEPHRQFHIEFKVYNDGLGFRYHLPQQNDWSIAKIKEEKTEFQLTGNHTCWWIPGDWDIYEHLYNTTRFSEIDAIEAAKEVNLAQTYVPNNAVNTPITMKTDNGLYLSFHEANLTDYPGMTLKVDTANNQMTSCLVGGPNEYKAKCHLNHHTPWRTIQIADRAGDLIESKLIVNLNEPNKLGDVSWFKPTKYMGIWWEMHLDKSSWDLESGRHGATTINAKAFIDFASKNNIGAVLVEGWNTGWEKWIGFEDREGVFDFVTPYPDYDLEEVVRYGKEKGVEIIMHHETSAAPRTYEQQLDTAYQLMQSLGIHAVKTGYVGKIIPKGEYHHGQWMVKHYRKVVENGAKYQVAINAHEPIKATGLRRTYPNIISREGLRGQEFNAWAGDGGNPPEHLTIVPFTRMLSGPIDFTPGIFNIKLDPYRKDNQVNTTLAHQLALYVVIYSPIQMAADLIENYQEEPAFNFISDVPTNWSETVVIDGEIGEYVVIARKDKQSENWYVGAVTDENEREIVIPMSFLERGIKYGATIYKDAMGAHWDTHPTAYTIERQNVWARKKLKITLAPGGGVAISIKKP